jgi:hypothetical protein
LPRHRLRLLVARRPAGSDETPPMPGGRSGRRTRPEPGPAEFLAPEPLESSPGIADLPEPRSGEQP